MTNPSASAVYRRDYAWQAALALGLFGLLLLITACSDSQEDNEAEPYPAPNPLFYEIANADGEVEGWMLGTIHALPEGVSWRTGAINQAIEKSDLLVVEVASLGQGDGVRQAFLELSQSPGLAPLNERVSPALRPELDAMIAQANTSRAILRSSEDWAAAIMLARADAPGDPKFGVDRALIQEFEGRKVIGFETAREQLGIFDTLAPEDQRALLEGTIEDWASSKGNRDRLMRAWLSGDAGTIKAATTEGIMDDPELREALLAGRNVDWIEQLGPILETDPKPLIGVGAAHLLGPDGLISMLEGKGYRVRRVSAP